MLRSCHIADFNQKYGPAIGDTCQKSAGMKKTLAFLSKLR